MPTLLLLYVFIGFGMPGMYAINTLNGQVGMTLGQVGQVGQVGHYPIAANTQYHPRALGKTRVL